MTRCRLAWLKGSTKRFGFFSPAPTACATRIICGSRSSPACCRPCSGPWPLHQRSLLALAQGKALSPMQGSSLRHRRPRCGHDGQRKRVAHMPTAATTTEDSRSKLAQNHPHDFTMKDTFKLACTFVDPTFALYELRWATPFAA